MRRAALGLLRVAARLLAAQEDTAEALLRSLNLLPRLHPNVAWELAEPIAQQASKTATAVLMAALSAFLALPALLPRLLLSRFLSSRWSSSCRPYRNAVPSSVEKPCSRGF